MPVERATSRAWGPSAPCGIAARWRLRAQSAHVPTGGTRAATVVALRQPIVPVADIGLEVRGAALGGYGVASGVPSVHGLRWNSTWCTVMTHSCGAGPSQWCSLRWHSHVASSNTTCGVRPGGARAYPPTVGRALTSTQPAGSAACGPLGQWVCGRRRLEAGDVVPVPGPATEWRTRGHMSSSAELRGAAHYEWRAS